MNRDSDGGDEYFDLEAIKRYMLLSPEEKLIYLEKINNLLKQATPEESKKAWEELKKGGW